MVGKSITRGIRQQRASASPVGKSYLGNIDQIQVQVNMKAATASYNINLHAMSEASLCGMPFLIVSWLIESLYVERVCMRNSRICKPFCLMMLWRSAKINKLITCKTTIQENWFCKFTSPHPTQFSACQLCLFL